MLIVFLLHINSPSELFRTPTTVVVKSHHLLMQLVSVITVGHTEGKIWLARLGIIHVILLKTSHCPLSHILQTKWPVILDAVGYADCKSIVQYRKYCFSRSYRDFSYATYNISYL